MKKRILLVLLGIFLLGTFLRFWRLSSYPIHLSIDEVAIGYNAFSILETGRDEYGSFLPLAFKSVGDFKPPVLIYLLVPFVSFFGLTEFAIRFPIALIGSFTILLVFFLIKKLTKNETLALLTSFFLAISPWHIQISRGSFEAILALFFVLLGLFFFLESLRGKEKFLFISILSFVLSMYTYHAERVFTPLFFLCLLIVYRQRLFKLKEVFLKTSLFVTLILLPLGIIMLRPEGQTRAKMTFISQDIEISGQLHRAGESFSLTEKIFDNNFLILTNFWVKRYLNYWDPSFLFFRGMRLTLPGCPGIGLLHLFELPLFLLGLILFLFKRNLLHRESKKIISLWLLIGPLAASLANNDQHALRSLTVIPMPQFLSALGFFFLWEKLKRKILWQRAIMVSVILVTTISLVYWSDQYFLHYPIHYSEYYDYDFKTLSLYAWQHQKEYQEIIVDYQFGTEGPYITGVPHLYMLFYGQYNPSLYQKRPILASNDFANFTFRPIFWPKDRLKKKTLFIGSPWSLPSSDLKEEQILKKIYFKNGQLGFLIVESLN